ncbi:MAG: hypothetical protein KOO69_08115 [Victivallales bacterium]|nr:hypothetical protein [Victivallales bacterium]
MKYLLLAILAGFFVINPAVAEEQTKERGRRKERTERKLNRKTPGEWRILQYISKEEATHLRKLHATNIEAWKEEVAKITKRIRQEKQKSNKKIQDLVRQYKSAKDEASKKEALEQLQTITQKAFQEKMKKNKKRLESLEKHVKKLRYQYEFRQKNADKIIQSRLKTLTKDKKFDW